MQLLIHAGTGSIHVSRRCQNVITLYSHLAYVHVLNNVLFLHSMMVFPCYIDVGVALFISDRYIDRLVNNSMPYGGDMRKCFRALAAGKLEQTASLFGTQLRTQTSDYQRHLPPPTIVYNAITTRPWPTRLKEIGISWMTSHTEHNSESILSRNDSPLDCLHLALACRYYFVWRRHENMSPRTGSR